MQIFFFYSAKIVTTQDLPKIRPPPLYESKIIAAEVWLHGAHRKGLEDLIKEPKSVSNYHAPSLRNHGKKTLKFDKNYGKPIK